MLHGAALSSALGVTDHRENEWFWGASRLVLVVVESL